MQTKKNKLNRNNIVYGLDFGTTSLKISKNELIDSHDFKVIDYLKINYPEHLTKKVTDFTQFKDYIVRSFNKIDGEPDETKLIERKVLVTLPMSHYTSRIIPVSMPISGNRVEHEHKVDLINMAREKCKGGIILHTAPLTYRIDGKVIKDPIFRTGSELSMDLFVVSYNEFIFEQFNNLISSLNMQLGKFIAPPFSFINLFLNKAGAKEREQDVFCIDVGGEVTFAYYISNGLLRNFISLPYGGDIMSRDLAYVLKTKMSDAEKLKVTYASMDSEIEKDDILNKEFNYSLKEINQVVAARYEEIIAMIEDEMEISTIVDNRPKLLLLGKGNPAGADKFLSERWDLEVFDVSSISSQPEHIYAVGNIHYSQNNEIFLYDSASIQKSIFTRMFRAVEDLF